MSKKQITEILGIQEKTLEDMLHILLDRGMLRAKDCGEDMQISCTSCPFSSECGQSQTIVEYFITDKGRRYALA